MQQVDFWPLAPRPCASVSHRPVVARPRAVAPAAGAGAATITERGDVWALGRHRVMCGDSTAPADVAHLLQGRVAALLHADPPYGMGKEAAGVANDNLRGPALDRFQMAWWAAWRPHLAENASAYIWGNAADLWRLWYSAGLGAGELLTLRNEIAWDKEGGSGQRDPGTTMFPVLSERCLFFQFGEQHTRAPNAGEFPASWAPLLAYLSAEAEACGLDAPAVRRICGVGMFSHWFTRSQFTLIPARHYSALAQAFPGRFARPWGDIKAEWDKVKREPTAALHAARSFFDNTHEAMGDVWRYPRVLGAERWGHATPKPVDMMARVMRSSLPPGGLCLEPFGGSGATLMGAEVTGRDCYTMELLPRWADVIVRRWQQHTGEAAVLLGDGRTFAELAEGRLALAA